MLLTNERPADASTLWPDIQSGIEQGRTLLKAGDVGGAVSVWTRVAQAWPDSAAAYQAGGSALLIAGRHAEAHELLAGGRSRFPDERSLLVDWAWANHHLRAWDQALAAWADVRQAFPSEWIGFTGPAATLRDRGDYEAAEALLREGRELLGPALHHDIDLGWVLTFGRSYDRAIDVWSSVRAQAPDHPAGYLGAGAALRHARRFAEAVELLREARQRFPDHSHALVELAMAVQQGGDRTEATALWAEMRAVFPDHVAGYQWGAFCLRESGDPNAAEDVVRAGLARFPGHAGLLTDHARIAQQRGDHAEAARRWSAARTANPDAVEAYSNEALALRRMQRHQEARLLLDDAARRFPDRVELDAERAHACAEAGAWADAAALWTRARTRSPDRFEFWLHEASALRQAQRVSEARSLLAEALERFPDKPELLNELGVSAHVSHDLAAADEAFARMRMHHPARAEGYLGGARVLLAAQDSPAAEALLEQGLAAAPTEPHVALQYARIRLHQKRLTYKDWKVIDSRFSALLRQHPGFEIGFLERVRANRLFGRLDRAEQAGRAAVARFPSDALILNEYALVARDREDWPEARRRFLQMRERCPHALSAVTGLIDVLVRSGRVAEAETELKAALERSPNDLALLTEHARMATRLGDWPEACRRWERAARLYPQDEEVRRGLFGAQQMASAESGAATAVVAVEPDQAALRDLLLRFESLSGTIMGCEFGLVQRAYGAEPLGLLRWSNIGPQHLSMALQQRFGGVGTPEQTELHVTPPPHREYLIRDRHFRMAMHTFLHVDQVDADRVLRQSLARLSYLRRKLIDDLGMGEKIFVYRLPDRVLSDGELAAIRAGMQLYGENILLYVRLADASNPPGSVSRPAPGLMVGHIDRFQIAPDGAAGAPNPAGWLAVCRRALELWQSPGHRA